ncbi:hypothetical protein ACJJIK_03925 [Microbulbifer sp. ZKSA006]|uniref:hypothetical protein n=1 Tax=Microbulbifer sp. ZKSA006 TaxID=3243390 RepID=UPI0040393CCC
MANINSLDLDHPIIEQIDDMYWLPFHKASSFQYYLGGWSLSFLGQKRQKEFNSSEYTLAATLIDEDYSYLGRNKIKPQHEIPSREIHPRWRKGRGYISFGLYPLSTICSVKVGLADSLIVGTASFDIRLIQVGEPYQSRLFNLSDHNQLKQFIFKKHNDNRDALLEKGCQDYFTAWSQDEIQEYKIKGRSWYELVDGYRNSNWHFNLYTHLSDSHLLHITYEPSQFWPPYHVPSKKALQISKSPLRDFMDNLELSRVKKNFPVIESIP